MQNRGKVIARMREERGWTLQDLAERVELSLTAVRNRESGQTRIKAHEDAVWAKAFGIPVETFRKMAEESALPLRPAEHPGIPIINKARAGPAWDFEHYGVDSRQGFDYMDRLPGEESDDLFAVIVTGPSMEPELHEGDRVVLWPVVPGVPPQTIDGRIVCVTFREEAGGGTCLAKIAFTGKSDRERGLQADLIKLNSKFKGKRIWLTDLDRLAVATRVHRSLS